MELGLLDRYDVLRIVHFKDEGSTGWEDRLLYFLLQLTRRNEASATTIENIRKLSERKQQRMMQMAHNLLPPPDWKIFKTAIEGVMADRVALANVRVKLPMVNHATIERRVVQAVKETM